MSETLVGIMNNESSALDPKLMREIINSLGEETAYPPVRHMVRDWNPAFGSCVPATVVYIAIKELEDSDSVMKAFLVRDLEQEGTPIEAHFVMTDGKSCVVDFTPAKHGEGEFALYSDQETSELIEDMLSEETLPQRVGVVLERIGSQYDVDSIFTAFRRALKKCGAAEMDRNKVKETLVEFWQHRI